MKVYIKRFASYCSLLITMANSLKQEKAKLSGLIWIQTVLHSDDVPKIIFESYNFEKKYISRQQNIMENLTASCKKLKYNFCVDKLLCFS